MRENTHITELLAEARLQKRCVIAQTKNEWQALHYRSTHAELCEPLPNCFIEPDLWKSLRPHDKTMYLVRTLHMKYPHRAFAAITAAVIHNYWVSWNAFDDRIHWAALTPKSNCIHYSYHYCRATNIVTVNDIPVTNPVETIIDCALMLPFVHALPIIDSALRQGVSVDEIMQSCSKRRQDVTAVLQIMRYANPLSENGGESWVRANIIELGFLPPLLQVPFHDTQTGKTHRVDFLWILPNGKTIVLEYDGMQKYTDPLMHDGSSTAQRVVHERERDIVLHNCGVERIVHVFYKDVAQHTRFVRILQELGVPKATG